MGRVSGNLFVPEAMPRRKEQFAPGKLAQAIEGVSKGGFLPLLARSKAIPSAIEIAEGKQWWLLIRRFVDCVGYADARPLGRWRTSETATWAHTSTWVLK